MRSQLKVNVELDTSKLVDQLNAIQMAVGALAHNLNEIDALYEEGEKGTYTETMTKPEAVEAEVNYNNLHLLLRDLRETESISLEVRNVLTKIINEHKTYTERSRSSLDDTFDVLRYIKQSYE